MTEEKARSDSSMLLASPKAEEEACAYFPLHFISSVSDFLDHCDINENYIFGFCPQFLAQTF